MTSEIEVGVPVRTAYDQWTQFTDFPLFMSHVKEVEQIDETHVRFKASILGIKREWEAEITEQTPDQRIAWTAVDGVSNSGVVTFHPLSDTRTRLVLQLEMNPKGLVEQLADKGGFATDRAEMDLRSFKQFIEKRGRPTGGFRGEVSRDADHTRQRLLADYEERTKAELVEMAKDSDIDGASSMTKDELAEELAARHR